MNNSFFKKLVLILVLAVSGASVAHAELVWKNGYVILTNGDSVKGDIKVNTKKELTLFQKVTMKITETSTKTYKPEQVAEYGFEESKFLARKVDGEMQFMKVLASGRVNLFEWQYELQRGNELVVEKEYFIEKNDGAGKLEKAKPAKFKKTVAELMADHTDLVARIQNEDKKYEIAQMQSIVEEYNTWYEEQNGSLQGKR
jgi:hypothetical protein